MAEMPKAVEQAVRFWQDLGRKQQWMMAGGALLTVALLLVFVRQAASPNYKVLLNGLTPADAQAIAADLTAKNIPNQVDATGTTLSVAADLLDAARLEVASQ